MHSPGVGPSAEAAGFRRFGRVTPSALQLAWAWAGGRCECKHEGHGHPDRCDRALIWEQRDRRSAASWTVRLRTATAGSTPENSEIVCWRCSRSASQEPRSPTEAPGDGREPSAV